MDILKDEPKLRSVLPAVGGFIGGALVRAGAAVGMEIAFRSPLETFREIQVAAGYDQLALLNARRAVAEQDSAATTQQALEAQAPVSPDPES